MDTSVKTNEELCDVYCVHDEIVAPLKQSVHEEDIAGMALMFKALSDPTRVKIAFLLSQGQELCVCDIAELLDSSIATTSHHLRQLKSAHIAKSRKEGKNVFYSLQDHHIHTLMTMTLEHQKEKSGHDR
ncbi:ArsR/SmtB family transcription factor [Paenibacillus caui]|uniref:ArsR/SmtB family transcription factor n=1 Tax=Paenibacillus caui TaxID=2873927 RepID=UPI001CA7D164|nr:metalloregulator ArsR/SmtB family transcription factor [Paenibacillus caui]